LCAEIEGSGSRSKVTVNNR